MERAVKQEIVGFLRELEPEATMCPGRLARKLGSSLPAVRPCLIELHKAGVIVATQRGRPCAIEVVRGPFRIALQRGTSVRPV